MISLRIISSHIEFTMIRTIYFNEDTPTGMR